MILLFSSPLSLGNVKEGFRLQLSCIIPENQMVDGGPGGNSGAQS